MAYTLSNMCAKNLCKRTVLVQLVIKNVVTFFWNSVHTHTHTHTKLITHTADFANFWLFPETTDVA